MRLRDTLKHVALAGGFPDDKQSRRRCCRELREADPFDWGSKSRHRRRTDCVGDARITTRDARLATMILVCHISSD